MRGRTQELHVAAERSGVVAALFRGQVSRSGYALYLRNLLPAYQAMEQALQQFGNHTEFEELAQPSIYRAAAIVSDLEALSGSDWTTSVPLLTSGQRYAARVEWAGTGALLIAHCYTRYLGDLNGGQLLRQHLVRRFGANFQALAFSRFPEIPDLTVFGAAYRQSLNRAGSRLSDVEGVIAEAVVAFDLNIAVSLEVDAFLRRSPA